MEQSNDAAVRIPKDYAVKVSGSGLKRTLSTKAEVAVGRCSGEKIAPIYVVFDNPDNTEPHMGFVLSIEAAEALSDLLGAVLDGRTRAGWSRVYRFFAEASPTPNTSGEPAGGEG